MHLHRGIVLCISLLMFAGGIFSAEAQNCECKCSFPKNNQITRNGKQKIPGGTRYTFASNANVACTGEGCAIQSVSYNWTIAGSATATIFGPPNAESLLVDVTNAGNLTVTCTVTVTCIGGMTCTCIGTHSWNHLK